MVINIQLFVEIYIVMYVNNITQHSYYPAVLMKIINIIHYCHDNWP